MSHNHTPRHVILIGPMGVGKTTVGTILARRLQIPLLDSDVRLAAKTGKSGSELTAESSVTELHRLERQVFLEAVATRDRAVITPAASVLDHETTRALLREHDTVWLDANPAVTITRSLQSGHRRTIREIEAVELEGRRSGWYASCSTVRVDAEANDAHQCAEEILNVLRKQTGSQLGHGKPNG